MDTKPYKIIISGGGTGGHIYPAISIAQEFKLRFPDCEILFVGANDRMEMTKVPKAGFEIVGLWISGLQRKISINNIQLPFKIVSSIMKSNSILRAFKPQIAIGVGGYASGPLLYVASRRRIPTLIHEQNSYAGITNKLLAKRVDKICVAYNGMERFFSANKLVMTGNPIREDIMNLADKRQKGFAFFGLDPNIKTILILGGSLGARTINNAFKQHLEKLKSLHIQILWQTGAAYYEELKSLATDEIKIHDFIYEMDLAYSVADIVVSRAGASTISELAVVDKPAILVPSPNVSEDHQTKNAMALMENDATWMVADKDAIHDLVDKSIILLGDDEEKEKLSNNISKMAIRDSAKRIVEEALKLMKAHEN